MGRNQRKWRNILLDLNFQLSFTLLMVAVAGALLLLLGFWVKNVAHESTLVGLNRLEPMCEDLRPVDASAAPTMQAPVNAKERAPEPKKEAPPEPAPPPPADGEPPGTDEGAADGSGTKERPRPQVVIENTSMELEPATAPTASDPGPRTQENYDKCVTIRRERVERLWSSYRLILIVLFGSSVLLIIGLGLHGLRMTHKVAGPLFKVGLYLDKMKRGVYDQVWNLRKGDQLTEFYEHFRAAHRELVAMQAEDIAVIEKVVAAAQEAEDELSDDAKAALDELRKLLAAKKEGLQVPEDKRG